MRRTVPVFAASLLLATAGGAVLFLAGRPAPAQAPSAPAPSVAARPVASPPQDTAAADAAARAVSGRNKDLPNFGVVAPGIYRGAAPTSEGLRRLQAMGVRTVIDLRIERKGQKEEAAAAQQLGLNRLRLPMGREAPTAKQVAAFVGTLADPAKRPVFVHCQHGADRTGAMIGIWRVTRQDWDWGPTWTEMRRYGFKPWLSELKQAVASRAR